MSDSTAILLVGHGTRDAVGTAEFFHLADLLVPRFAPSRVFPCFLELAEPTIDAAVHAAIEANAEQIVVMPVLLFAAGHAKNDIPAAVEAAIRRATSQSERGVAWRQAGVLESNAMLVDLSARRFAEATGAMSRATAQESLDDSLNDSPHDTCLILVGRGSRHADATAEMHRFAALRRQATPVGRCDVAFVAMAEPKYPDVLDAAARRGHRRIVVQPHLLFAGELLGKLRRDVAALSEQFTASQWVVAAHLGPDPLLADAVESLCRSAMVD